MNSKMRDPQPKIYAKELYIRDACLSSIDRFMAEFPDGAESWEEILHHPDLRISEEAWLAIHAEGVRLDILNGMTHSMLQAAIYRPDLSLQKRLELSNGKLVELITRCKYLSQKERTELIADIPKNASNCLRLSAARGLTEEQREGLVEQRMSFAAYTDRESAYHYIVSTAEDISTEYRKKLIRRLKWPFNRGASFNAAQLEDIPFAERLDLLHTSGADPKTYGYLAKNLRTLTAEERKTLLAFTPDPARCAHVIAIDVMNMTFEERLEFILMSNAPDRTAEIIISHGYHMTKDQIDELRRKVAENAVTARV